MSEDQWKERYEELSAALQAGKKTLRDILIEADSQASRASRERLRDMFAAHAIQGIVGLGEPFSEENLIEIATDAYRIADALMKARDK